MDIHVQNWRSDRDEFQCNRGKAVYGVGFYKGGPVAESAQGKKACPAGYVGASMVRRLGMGKGT